MTTSPSPRPADSPGQQPAGYNPYGSRAGAAPAPPAGPSGPPPAGVPGYNPYTQPPPPGGPVSPLRAVETPARPRVITIAFGLIVLVSLAWAALGILVGSRIDAAYIQQSAQASGTDLTGVPIDQAVSLIRVLAYTPVIVAAVYVLFGWFAFAGRSWARILVAVLSTVFVLVLLLGLLGGFAADLATALLLLALLAVPVAAVVLLFVRPASNWYAAVRG